jgi:heat shock protein HtpX
MLKANGLYGHIQNNNLKSMLLLLGFAVVVQVMAAALICFATMLTGGWKDFYSFANVVLQRSIYFAPVSAIGAFSWVGFAFKHYKSVIVEATRLRPVERWQEPRLYETVENLAISVGLTTPQIEVIDTPALGAFAIGLSPNSSTIGVSRGLLNELSDKELEAVIAHEIIHIRNLDVRLVTIATILCGIVFSVGWMLTYRVREMYCNANVKSVKSIFVGFAMVFSSVHLIFHSSLLPNLSLMLSLVFLAVLLGQMLRFSISRKREFIADAGSIELTQNPEALISALCKMSGRGLVMPGGSLIQAMMITGPTGGLMSTHPTLQSRIDSLVAHAAHALRGYTLKPAFERVLAVSFAVEGGFDFSIIEMRYPAWISRPRIVLPALAITGLSFVFMTAGPFRMFSGILGLPQLLIAAPVIGSDFLTNLPWAKIYKYLCTALALTFFMIALLSLKKLGLVIPFIRKMLSLNGREVTNNSEAAVNRDYPNHQTANGASSHFQSITGEKPVFGKRKLS